jgi:hypothetical protein
MADARAERIAENEVSFRELNERLGVMGVFLCECGDASCRQHVEMPRDHYRSIRTNPRRFFVRPGHEKPDVESVVERADGWYVVEKPDEVAHIVEQD